MPTGDAFFDKLDFPMFVLTTAVGAERSGCLVGFVTQCSMDPPRLLVCVSEANHTHGVVQRAGVVAVHLIPRDAEDIVRLFGSTTGDDVDKFGVCAWEPGPGGVPLLAACPSRLSGRVLERFPVGDHLALLVSVDEACAGEEPLFMFSKAKELEVEPGHPA